MCVILRIISLYATNGDKPKITPIGRWLEEHTDMDVIGFYHHMVEQFTEQKRELMSLNMKETYKNIIDLKKN